MNKYPLFVSLLLLSLPVLAQGNIAAGKAKSTTCVACHGVDGISMIGINPNLAGQHANYLFKQLNDYKLGTETQGERGRYNASMAAMVMPLTEQDMADLAAYYASLPINVGVTPISSIDVAQSLYRYGDKQRQISACIACHGPRGNGTTSSGFPNISGQQPEYAAEQLKAFRSGMRHNDMNGMMRSVANKLTDQEIEALAQYVGGLH